MFKQVLLAALFIVSNLNIYANDDDWGATGHRVVGEIATKHLKSRVKKKIRKILGNESIAISSNWADFIKSDSTLRYLDPWHYINIKAGLSQADFSAYLQKDTATDAYTKINFLVAELKNKTLPLDKQAFYLKLLIHIVGDVHQPMHVGRLEDLGGNRVRVMWFNENTNLHAVWDDRLIEFQKLSYTEYTENINHSTKQEREAWQKQPLSEWLFESYQYATKIYDATKPEQRLSFNYNYDFIGILNQQLLKGGVRLAGLLNEIYG
jgi:hypothetical protein